MIYDKVILFSGGIDSYVGYWYLNEPQPIYFNLKSKYSDKEISNFSNLNLNKNIIIDNDLNYLGQFEQDLNAHIPFRNLYMAMTASAKYSDTIYICGLKDDNVSDKNEKVFKEWSEHLSKLENRNIQILSPFWNMTKSDVVKWYSKHYDSNLLLNTISCYNDNDKSCYNCQSCFRRNCCLFEIGIKLPFYNNIIIEYYKNRIGTNIYDTNRELSMSKYIEYIEQNNFCRY
jgi:7-cyano-7-deazaguanine synthase in queuosine biosynthesis